MAQVMPPILMVVSKVATTEKFMLLSIKTQAQISTPRQPDAERRAAGLTFELNPALMFVKNLLANIEAWAAALNIADVRGQRGKAAERSSKANAACSSCSMAISTARLAHSSRCFECFRKLMDSVIFC